MFSGSVEDAEVSKLKALVEELKKLLKVTMWDSQYELMLTIWWSHCDPNQSDDSFWAMILKDSQTNTQIWKMLSRQRVYSVGYQFQSCFLD